jgi:hypothetical protein
MEGVAVHVSGDAGNPSRGRELPEGSLTVVVADLRLGSGAADPERIILELALKDFPVEGDVPVDDRPLARVGLMRFPLPRSAMEHRRLLP